MVRLIIDRFEGNIAVCEKSDGTMVNISVTQLPHNVKEGDVINIEGSTILVDPIATLERKDSARKLKEDLWRKAKYNS